MAWSDDPRFQQLLEQAGQTETLKVMEQVQEQLPDKPTYRNFQTGLKALLPHLETEVPEVLRGGLNIVEIGPGVGCFMVLARAFGNTVRGEEAVPSGVVDAYRKITNYWGLHVNHTGFDKYLKGAPFPYPMETVDVFHFRGSLDAVLQPFQSNIGEAVAEMFKTLTEALKPKGFVWIGHNQDRLLQRILEAVDAHHAPLQITPGCNPYTTRLAKA